MINHDSTYDEVLAEIEAGVEDCVGDMPEINPDDAFHDIAIGMLHDASPEVAIEIGRTQLGWSPKETRQYLHIPDDRHPHTGDRLDETGAIL